MLENSRRKEKVAKQAQQSSAAQDQTVNPVKVGSQKGSAVPKTRRKPTYVAQAQVQSEPEPEPQPEAVPEPKVQPEPEPKKDLSAQVPAPEWIEGYLKYQSEFMEQLANQIVEDHQILTDHDWRIRDIEERLGILAVAPRMKSQPELELEFELEPEPEPQPEPQAKAKAEPEPQPQPGSQVKAKVEPEPQPQPGPQVKAKVEPEPQPQPEPDLKTKAAIMDGVVPRQMYRAQSFEDGKWRLRGPFKMISQAEQAAKGDLSKVEIVQVWYDTRSGISLSDLTAEEMERYL